MTMKNMYSVLVEMLLPQEEKILIFYFSDHSYLVLQCHYLLFEHMSVSLSDPMVAYHVEQIK